MNRHGRSGGLGNAKKPNTKAAARRLANMMANQSGADDSDEEDDLFYEAAPTIGIGAGGRAARPRSPSVRTSVIDHPSQRRSLGTRASQPQSAENTDQESPKARSLVGNRAPQTFNYAEKPSSLSGIRASKPGDYTEEQLPSSHSSVGSRAPQSVNNVEPQQQPSAGSRTPKSINYVGRPASPMASSRQSFNYAEQQPSSARSNSSAKLSQPHLMDQSQSVRSSFSARSSQSPRSAEHVQAPLGRSGSGGRTSHSIGSMEQPLSAKSSGSGRPGLGVKSVPMLPQSVPLKLKPSLSGIPGESPRKMLSIDMGSMKFRDSGHQNSASALQDEVDMLQEENESLVEKLRLAEVRFRESEMRTRELEKQVANLGEGVSMETRLLSRKEAELQEREAALKAVQQSFGGKGEEIVSLRMEAESAREEANSALDQLQDATREVKSLRIMTKRLMLTQEEMFEALLHLVIITNISPIKKSRMQVEIISRELVKPFISTQPRFQKHKLSLVDELAPVMNVPIILYYPADVCSADKGDNENDASRCNILKMSLSKALTAFYPLAGRYIKESCVVDCSDQGAEFVEAKVNIQLNELLDQGKSLMVDRLIDLLPCPIGAVDEVSDPLLAVQVSVFACCGCSIGVCIPHRVADMTTFSAFIDAWTINAKQEVGEVFENYLPSSPSWNSALLFPGKKVSGLSVGISRTREYVDDHKIVTKMFFFNKTAISSMREKARVDSLSGKLPSRVQSVFGIIGKAIIDLHVANPGNPRRFLAVEAVNMRKRTDPPFSNNQMGNLCLLASVQSVAGENGVEFQSLVDLFSDSVKRAVEDCKTILSLGDEGQMMVANGYIELANSLSDPDTFGAGVYSDWSKFPLYETDFGWGKPVLVSVNVPLRHLVVLIDYKSGEGIEAWVSLHENDMPKFEHDCNIMEFTT